MVTALIVHIGDIHTVLQQQRCKIVAGHAQKIIFSRSNDRMRELFQVVIVYGGHQRVTVPGAPLQIVLFKPTAVFDAVNAVDGVFPVLFNHRVQVVRPGVRGQLV
ncbi:hypothetical protein SDC9_205239 [bioreactor metagenome]|uniref:Uncharacterized protein n=1 Tax=bioreactor metagenome TaxID=1076179 RepID=A0A645J1I3_9ZZZZ